LALGGHVSLYIPSVIDRKYTKSFFHHHHVPTKGDAGEGRRRMGGGGGTAKRGANITFILFSIISYIDCFTRYCSFDDLFLDQCCFVVMADHYSIHILSLVETV